MDPEEQAQLLGDVARLLGMFLPSGWTRSTVRYSPEGSSVEVTGLDGQTGTFPAPPALNEILAVLRQGAAEPWTAATFRLTFPDTHEIDYETATAPDGLRMAAAPLPADGETRPDVPEDERDALVRYLEQAPIVLAARSLDVDELDPGRAARVPLTFHTDGAWVWPGAVGYYLRAHDVAPDPELVAHARGNGFRPPEVDDATRGAAVTLIRS
ncbi:hypothetical protein DZF91_22225 [Actinomadura logoneensis]|uniref:Uncharacterized protein n=1 Tax=Actinomadura logoneensis TaxID=2293572 RepID=A0A372JI03_9ACTN|nr:hypothetical protein DZF91_22225 [Actinomadura logoneensis]